MSLITRFAGQYNALSFNYGGTNTGAPDAIDVLQGNPNTGAGTVYVSANFTVDQGANAVMPFVSGQTIQIGRGTALETVTLTAVGAPTLVGPEPSAYSIPLSATFSYVHGYGDPVFSATYGLQEAINVAAGTGSGTVIVDEAWYAAGGTLAIILTAIIPVTANVAGVSLANTLRILDVTTLTFYELRYSTVTPLVAPTIPLITQVASLAGVVGTFTAATYYVNFAYVDAKGGITLASSQYSFTATVSLAIGGSGPVAETGAVGYLVFTSATTTTYLAPVVQVTGAPTATIITCGGVKCFQIGTPFAVAAPGTSALAVVPVEATAYPTALLPVQSQNMLEPFNAVLPPFVATGTVTATSALEMGRLDLPAGFLNSIGRTLRITVNGVYTPVSTATLIFILELYSVYGHTGTVLVTIGNTIASSGTSTANFKLVFELTTAATGVTGTIEAHCLAIFQAVTSTAGSTGAAVATLDNTSAASGTVDLTKQDTLSFQVNSGTANLTTAQIRQCIVEVLQ